MGRLRWPPRRSREQDQFPTQTAARLGGPQRWPSAYVSRCLSQELCTCTSWDRRNVNRQETRCRSGCQHALVLAATMMAAGRVSGSILAKPTCWRQFFPATP
eukprot:scaffold1066_cov421-Prasinococcus_capsulatus_cf.AAC.2